MALGKRPHCTRCGRYLDKQPANAYGWCETCEFYAQMNWPQPQPEPYPAPSVPAAPAPWWPWPNVPTPKMVWWYAEGRNAGGGPPPGVTGYWPTAVNVCGGTPTEALTLGGRSPSFPRIE